MAETRNKRLQAKLDRESRENARRYWERKQKCAHNIGPGCSECAMEEMIMSRSIEPQVDVAAQARELGRQEAWQAAVLVAREGARLIPPDRTGSVHHFAAETVVKAVEEGARIAGVRFVA